MEDIGGNVELNQYQGKTSNISPETVLIKIPSTKNIV